MFISSSSVQGSLWGWTNKALPATTGVIDPANTNVNIGTFSGFTLAPNGYAYAIPTNVTTLTHNQVLLINPGNSNNGLTNYSNVQTDSVSADGSPTKPNFLAADAFQTKGILAQNGKIYFIPTKNAAYRICVLTPNTGTDCTWEFIAGDDLGVNGGILGRDGKIYLIPGGTSIKLQRLNPDDNSFETSFYDGTSVAGGVTKTCSSSGNTITSTTNMVGVTVGMRLSVPVTVAEGNTKGVLNSTNDTIVTALGPLPNQVTVNLVPDIPINNTSVIFADISKNLTGASTRRWFNFLNRVYTGSDFNADYNNSIYNLDRHSQQNLAGSSSASSSSVSSTAFLAGDFIYIMPGFGTQIFYIDTLNWSTKDALTTSPGLALKTVGIRSGISDTLSIKRNSFKKFTGVSVGKNSNEYYFSVLGASSTLSNFVNSSLQGIYKLDTNTNIVSSVLLNSSVTDYSAPGLLPNGDIVFIKTNNTNGGNEYKKNLVIDTTNGTYKADLKTFITRNTYPANISNTGYTTGANYPQTSFLSFYGNSMGKILMPVKGSLSIWGIEYLSVKGFYTGVRLFDRLDESKIKIPTDLADLPTSDYNIYRNVQS